MLIDLALKLAAVVTAVPITAFLLRYLRGRGYRELARGVAEGDIVAGAAANWLTPTERPMWSGRLVLTFAGTLRWEPDRYSIRRRRATVREWDAAGLTINVIRRRRGFTGERYEVLAVTEDDTSVAMFAAFQAAGPWHQRLRIGTDPAAE